MLQPGDTFGDYRVLKLLGKGGMGSVFLLENAGGAQIAAKILDPATAKDHEARKRFLREAQLALGVKHPNLVETYDVGEDPETGLCYILMEYVPNGSLADDLKENGALPIEDAVAVVQAMASVLELARRQGIVHRDIKPANIMFDAEGTPKLADLGIARGGFAGTETTTVTQTGMMIGTPAYMAPEQMLDAHHVDTRADIYSLGVVFFEMLTGERPNKDDTVVQLMAKAVKGEPLPDVRTFRPEVSALLAQLLAMMVAPDKDGRISTPGQITSALDIIERGGTFELADAKARRREASRAERKRRRRRHRLMLVSALGVVALVGLAGIGAGIAWLVRNGGTDVKAGADPQPTTVVPEKRAVAAARKTAAASNVVVRSGARADPVRKQAPEAVERIVVATNVVKEQTQSEEKPIAPSEPAKESKGVTDQRVHFAKVDDLTKRWPLGKLEDSRPIRHERKAEAPSLRSQPDEQEKPKAQPVRPCTVKIRPDLRSPACRLVLSCGVVINAEKGCGAAAASLKLKLESALKCAAPIYGSPQRKAPFVVNVSRNDPKVSSTADFTPGFESWSIRLAPDNDYFNDGLGSLAATILTICKEPDWMAFAFYGGGLIEEPMHGDVFRPDFRVPAYMQAGKESAGRQMGLWRVFEELRGWDSAFFTKYCRQKNRRFKEGALGPEIDYDAVVDLLTTVSGRNVVELFQKAGLGNQLRNKGPVGANAAKAVPSNANDGKTFNLQKVHGSTFQKTLQKTLDLVFPSWRLGSDYQGQVKLMSGQIANGRGQWETLGYVSRVLDRQHVVVLPLHFDALTPVLSCRRKMGEGEKLLCSVAFGQGIENCELVVQVNGRECYRTTLSDAFQWEDFEVDLSDWKGKSSRIDIMVRCVKEGAQGGLGRMSTVSKALLYVQRLEWGKR